MNTVSPTLDKAYSYHQFKFDFVAAIVVFLVAIPLCLGIALASGAPLFSGILSGIIGGIVVGALSGSAVSVSGPAAGMAAVVLAAIVQIGDFNSFLLALSLAGLLQIAIGCFRAGVMVEYVPSNVVQGLLCAIGILLIVKQLPLAFTLSSDFKELQAHLLETTEGFTLAPLQALSYHINSGAVLITSLSLLVLIYCGRTTNKKIQALPATIIVVVMGIILNELFVRADSILAQGSSHLVNIPQHHSVSSFMNQFEFPNFSAWQNPSVYFYAFIIASVASLESLLNIKAGEKLDTKRRICSKDRELIAQGVGNCIAGLIGGLPITSVIVRTSVNIQAGAKTKAATILHGIFLIIAILLISPLLNKIPLSTLAAILIYTGLKLTKLSIYVDIYKQGLNRFIPFVATVISIVMFNLLIGILIGLAISFFLSSKRTAKPVWTL